MSHRAAVLVSGRPPCPTPPPNKKIARAVARIHRRLDDNKLTIQALADVAALSPFHFAREFKKVVGIAPHGYVLRQRLALARELLAHHQHMSITEVVMSCGFATSSHFANAFRGSVWPHAGRVPQEGTALAQAKVAR